MLPWPQVPTYSALVCERLVITPGTGRIPIGMAIVLTTLPRGHCRSIRVVWSNAFEVIFFNFVTALTATDISSAD